MYLNLPKRPTIWNGWSILLLGGVLHALRSDTPANPSSAIFLLGALHTLREFELHKKVIFLFTPPVKLAGQQVQINN